MKNVMMINRLRIKYDKKADSLSEAYSVWTPDGKCWEDRLTLDQAVAYCQDTKDFVIRPISKDSIQYLQKWIKVTDPVRDSIGRHLKRYPYLGNITAYYKDWDDFCSDWTAIGYTKIEPASKKKRGPGCGTDWRMLDVKATDQCYETGLSGKKSGH